MRHPDAFDQVSGYQSLAKLAQRMTHHTHVLGFCYEAPHFQVPFSVLAIYCRIISDPKM